MAQLVANDPLIDDPRVADAILQYLEAHESDTPLNEETWISSQPEEIRPVLQSFLNNRAIVVRARQQTSLPLTQPDTLNPFGSYREFKFIAQGGMGAIYRCRDTRLERPIAIKVLHQRLMSHSDMLLRFKAEAQVAAQLIHPNIAPVHETGELPDGRPYFTMKLVEGDTLSVAIREYHANPNAEQFERLLRDFVAICNGVEYAHSRGVLHRDLKPINVMIGKFGEVQVMDWGLTKVLGPSATEAEIEDRGVRTLREGDVYGESQPGVRGTPAYMPPEQANGSKNLDARCDVFALGAILCQMLIGRPPYISDNPDPQKRTRELLALAQRGDTNDCFAKLDLLGEPAELIALCKQCLAFAPASRPASAKAVGDAVTRFQANAQQRAQDAELGRVRAEAKASAERRKRQWQLGTAAALLLLVTGGVAGGIWYRFDREAKQAQEAARIKEEERLRNEQAAGVRSAVDDMYGALRGDQAPRATAALASAKGRLGSNAPAELTAFVSKAEENHSIHRDLERIRIEKGILKFDDTPLFDDTARAYAQFFAKKGFDIDDPDLPGTVADSPIRDILIAAFDDWATHERDPARQDHLFAILRQADPNSAWANRLRNREVRKDQKQLRALLDEAPWRHFQLPFLYALTSAFENDPELAGPLLRTASAQFANDFIFNIAAGTTLVMQPTTNPVEKSALRKKALGYFRTAVALRPDNEVALAVFAMFTIEDGDFDEANLLVERLEGLKVESWTKYMALGRLAQKQGQHRFAVQHYKKASELSDHLATRVELAQAHLFVGNMAEAMKVVDEILKQRPDHPGALPLKAVILAIQQKTDLAWPIAKQVLEANPRSMGGRIAIFACLIMRGRFLDAGRVLESFTPEERESESLGHLEFLFDIVRGDLERALKLMTSLPADTPTYGVDCIRIQVLANLGRLAEAKALTDKTIKTINDNRVDIAALTGGEITNGHLQFIAAFLPPIIAAEGNLDNGPAPDMKAIREKKPPAINLITVADLLIAKRRFHDSLRIYEYLLPPGEKLGSARGFSTLMTGTARFKAMRAAAQSLAGTGRKTKPLAEAERNQIRGLALRWFEEEVDALRKVVDSIEKIDPSVFDRKAKEANLDLHSLRLHRELNPLRNLGESSDISEADRKKWKELWVEVDRMLLKLNPPIEWLKLPEV